MTMKSYKQEARARLARERAKNVMNAIAAIVTVASFAALAWAFLAVTPA